MMLILRNGGKVASEICRGRGAVDQGTIWILAVRGDHCKL